MVRNSPRTTNVDTNNTRIPTSKTAAVVVTLTAVCGSALWYSWKNRKHYITSNVPKYTQNRQQPNESDEEIFAKEQHYLSPTYKRKEEEEEEEDDPLHNIARICDSREFVDYLQQLHTRIDPYAHNHFWKFLKNIEVILELHDLIVYQKVLQSTYDITEKVSKACSVAEAHLCDSIVAMSGTDVRKRGEEPVSVLKRRFPLYITPYLRDIQHAASEHLREEYHMSNVPTVLDKPLPFPIKI